MGKRSMAEIHSSQNIFRASRQMAKSHLANGAMVSLLKSFAFFGNKKPRRHRVAGEVEALG